ncbi:FAD binding domain-containing protein [Phlyctema vagabunda]|uniref:FAD binding domain-containing protein n=1 Tax=Phlyctema vagabunda TaxID=108571 RepID=A0ABR4P4J3_9HELO
MASLESPVLIIGAGVVGLVLAQSLKKEGIPFLIFDRDAHIDARGHGWGITIHWALAALEQCLSPSLFSRLASTQVDPEQGRNDTGQFLFLNLANAEPVFQIPPSKRLRINREKFRKLLLEGIHVQWNKSVSSFCTSAEGVSVKFQDGGEVSGRLLIGADGATSKLRRTLNPTTGALNQLPIRFLGVTVKLSPTDIKPLRDLDPLLFQGCHPETGTYMWYSTLDTPEVNGSSGDGEYYSAQLNISWLVKVPEDEVPTSNAAKLQKIKSLTSGFEKNLKKAIDDIPEGTEIIEITLADWPCLEWPNHEAKVTLIGDAAHAMTMYRGEAANHGITDARHLHDHLLKLYRGEVSLEHAIQGFEEEMRKRTSWAVLMSRQACLDAHDFARLNKDSAILARRAEKI